MMVAAATTAAYNAALERRQALMGASGARALAKNWKVARIAAFACIGGVLYGYNQGMFSGILAMPAFGKRECPTCSDNVFPGTDDAQIWMDTLITPRKRAG